MTEAVAASGARGPFPEERGYIPQERNVIEPEVLARVFSDQPLPFKTNSDGSVDVSTYTQWLDEIWQQGMQAFESDAIVSPNVNVRAAA
ncbi:hypothetical protein FX016_23165 [Cupriavidus gilardii]|nr:hypothetical protein FX016_23165 [Cupriavidus gilardii]